jgi:hypothetical protein
MPPPSQKLIARLNNLRGALTFVQRPVYEAVDAAISEQAWRLATLSAGAGLADVAAAWIKPTVHGLQEAPEEGVC